MSDERLSNGRLTKELVDAICGCFNLNELELLVEFRLGETLSRIVDTQSDLQSVAHELVSWSDRHDRRNELVAAIWQERPQHSLITTLYQRYCAPQPAYENEKQQEAGEMLEGLRQTRDVLIADGVPQSEINSLNEQIREYSRAMKVGIDLAPGWMLSDRYRLLARIGYGGFGSVWRAFDTMANEIVAIKVLLSHLARNSDKKRRFQKGAVEMARLNHHHVVSIREGYREEGPHCYFVMDYLAGGTFLDLIKRQESTLSQRLKLLLQVADALVYAHGQSIVHRDVSPENILLNSDHSEALLTDFDLVRVDSSTGGTTRTGSVGKFMYMAPESLNPGAQPDVRFDVYSLGITTTLAVFGSPLPAEDIIYERREFISTLDAPQDLINVLLRATDRWPDQRYGTIEELADALRTASWDRVDGVRKQAALVHSNRQRPESILGNQVGGDELHPVTTEWIWPEWAARHGVDACGLWAEIEVNEVPQRMRWIPPGEYYMGAAEHERGRSVAEGPRHLEIIDIGFWIFDSPCTQGLWMAVMGTNPSRFKGDDSRPVEQVSWEMSQKFISRINDSVTGLTLRLPTEAEWEYVCRGGRSEPRYATNIDDIAWHKAISREQTQPVKLRQPNNFGVFDMLGNVWEWCRDEWRPRYNDGFDPYQRVIRGGSWRSNVDGIHAACRHAYLPTAQESHVGFRCVGSGDSMQIRSKAE
ncbi:MAG: SUMF1/EgtB/PvdO family nonheme iron enzyme [Planctomycetaceae bacterium]|nr:SUMF1/EgtB/PvdO family nonheme iron enzyme [Planctomycetaceae bacterium]